LLKDYPWHAFSILIKNSKWQGQIQRTKNPIHAKTVTKQTAEERMHPLPEINRPDRRQYLQASDRQVIITFDGIGARNTFAADRLQRR
jgi:hypothetical protein